MFCRKIFNLRKESSSNSGNKENVKILKRNKTINGVYLYQG
jgi:hypothetical protein